QRRHLHGSTAVAGIVLRLSAPARPWAHALSRCLLAASLGQRHAVHSARSPPRARIRPASILGPAAQSAAAGPSRRGHAARPAAFVVERRFKGATPRRDRIAGYPADQWRHPRFSGVFDMIATSAERWIMRSALERRAEPSDPVRFV